MANMLYKGGEFTPVRKGKYNLLLTSAGLTTEASQQACLEMARDAGNQKLRILRIVDALRPFRWGDAVGPKVRMEQRGIGISERLWSRRYLEYTLGKRAIIRDVTLDGLNVRKAQSTLRAADMLAFAGGNTFIGMRSAGLYRTDIYSVLAAGMPCVTDSAFTIGMGRTLGPAMLPPADPRPADIGLYENEGFGIVGVDIAVHVAGREGSIAIPGPLAALTDKILRGYETPEDEAVDYTETRRRMGLSVVALNDAEALRVQAGHVMPL